MEIRTTGRKNLVILLSQKDLSGELFSEIYLKSSGEFTFLGNLRKCRIMLIKITAKSKFFLGRLKLAQLAKIPIIVFSSIALNFHEPNFDLRTLLNYLHFIQVTNSFIIYSHLSLRHVEPCSMAGHMSHI